MALVVGGDELGPSVEVISPDGKCQHRLPDIPAGRPFLDTPTLPYIEDNIFACVENPNGKKTVIEFLIENKFEEIIEQIIYSSAVIDIKMIDLDYLMKINQIVTSS